MAISKDKDTTVSIERVKKETIRLYVVGTSPLINNRVTEKVQHELLLPKGKKTAADKQSAAKHDPLAEFRSSPYTLVEAQAPTLLAHKASAFKGAMRTAALDLPGGNKSQIGRLVYVIGELIPIYGEPQLFMAVTRSADVARTPDIRTRAIIPKWAAVIDVSFVSPIIKAEAVVNLLAAGGITSGVGDWRPEKGKGDYGQFRLANENDAELLSIMESGGRAAQEAAMQNPTCYDRETEEMLSWYDVEVKRRGFKAVGN